MVFLVGQSLAGAYYNRVTCMDSYRIHIFHVTDGDGCVIAVTHDFVFYLLVSLDAFFNQYLMNGRKNQSVTHDFYEFLLVVSKSATCSSQCKCRTQHDRISYFTRYSLTILNGVDHIGFQYRFPDTQAKFLEFFSVFCHLDAFEACT